MDFRQVSFDRTGRLLLKALDVSHALVTIERGDAIRPDPTLVDVGGSLLLRLQDSVPCLIFKAVMSSRYVLRRAQMIAAEGSMLENM